jgi:hypothetical protein
MKTIDTTGEARPDNTQGLGMPSITRKYGKINYEVYVHFSPTSTETISDKIMRLIRNEIGADGIS